MLNKYSELDKQYSAAILLFLIAAIIWVWGFNTSGLTRLDAHDYAQMGRELSEGNGFSTLQTFPRHIRYLHERGLLEKENWPNLYRFPLASMINAFLYTFIKDIAKVAILQSGIAFLLSVPIFFLLAARLTNMTVGIVSTIFFFGNPYIFEAGNDGMSEALAIFFILSAFLLCFWSRLSKWKCLCLGIICGLGYLARTELVLLTLLSILFIFVNMKKRERFYGCGLLLLGVLVSTGPWFARNIALTGTPGFSFNNTRVLLLETERNSDELIAQQVHPDLDLQLDAPVKTLDVIKQYGTKITSKYVKHISEVASLNLWTKIFPIHSVFLLFFLASFLYRNLDDSKYNQFRLGALLLILGAILIISLDIHLVRLFTPLQPLIYIIGINEVLFAIGNFRVFKIRKLSARDLSGVVLLFMVIVGLVRLGITVLEHRNSSPPLTSQQKQSLEYLDKITNKDSVVLSNISYATAMYAGCRSVRLPIFPLDILKINDDFLPIDYILLTNKMSQTYEFSNYTDFVKSEAFLNRFKFLNTLPDGSYLFGRLR